MIGDRPLSVGQQAMWFLHLIAPGSAAYNVTLGVRVRSAVDPARLARAVAAVEQRHDLLRSVYAQVGGETRRVVEPPAGAAALRVREVPGLDDNQLLRRARAAGTAPFALGAGERPFRVELLRRADDDAALVIVAHHIAADAPSLFLILRDLLDAYRAVGEGRWPALDPLPRSYDDYVDRERSLLAGPRAARMARHWAEVRAGSAAARLAPDRPPPVRPGHAGATRPMRAAPGFADRLAAAARATGGTPFTYLLGAFQAMLHRHTGQDDFLIGTAVALRVVPGLRDVVGYMVNTLPLRARFDADTTLADTVTAAGHALRQGLAYAGYPYPLMETGSSPLFRVTCTMLAMDRMAVPLPAERAGLRLSLLDVPQQEGQFDLSAELRYGADSLTGAFRYDTDVFEPATVDGFAERFTRFAELAVSEPRSRVADLPLLDEQEFERLLAFGGIG